MRLRILLALFIALILVRGAFAQVDPCNTIFGSTSSLPGTFGALRSASTYKGLLGYSMLIILSVLLIISFLYAIGMAFKIDRLTSFSRNEILENVLNFIIIIFISGGIAGIDNLIVGIANFGSSAIGGTTTSVTSTSSMYYNTCEFYYSDAIGQIWYIVEISFLSFIYNIGSGFTLLLMPNGLGIIIQPLAWLNALQKMMGMFGAFAIGIAGVELINVFLLAIIYYLFPLFLYLGILFRSFPWTRAIGGALLGVFISFYVFYPALVYSFSAIVGSIEPVLLASIQKQSNVFSNVGSLSQLSASSFSWIIPTETMFSLPIELFGNVIAVSAINVIGIIISLLICFDIIEAFGDLLGAPSLAHKGVLKKVI